MGDKPDLMVFDKECPFGPYPDGIQPRGLYALLRGSDFTAFYGWRRGHAKTAAERIAPLPLPVLYFIPTDLFIAEPSRKPD
jgi:hypothetical protein